MTTKLDDQIPSAYLKELGQRIALIAEQVGGKKRLAETAGISESQLYRCIRGVSATTIEPLLAMAHVAKVSVTWLVTGEGDMAVTAKPSPLSGHIYVPFYIDAIRPAPPETDVDDDNMELPASIDATVEGGTMPVSVSYQWLEERGLSPHSIVHLNNQSSSMAPTIPENCLVLSNTADKKLIEGSVYALSIGNDVICRRIQKEPSGKIWLLTDNPAYQATLLSRQEAAKIQIIGRVISICRDI